MQYSSTILQNWYSRSQHYITSFSYLMRLKSMAKQKLEFMEQGLYSLTWTSQLIKKNQLLYKNEFKGSS